MKKKTRYGTITVEFEHADACEKQPTIRLEQGPLAIYVEVYATCECKDVRITHFRVGLDY